MIRYMLLAALLAAIVILVGASPPQDAVEAHRYADSVLSQRFHAAYNDWAYQHPKDPEHWRNLDAGDVKRWQVVRKTYKET